MNLLSISPIYLGLIAFLLIALPLLGAFLTVRLLVDRMVPHRIAPQPLSTPAAHLHPAVTEAIETLHCAVESQHVTLRHLEVSLIAQSGKLDRIERLASHEPDPKVLGAIHEATSQLTTMRREIAAKDRGFISEVLALRQTVLKQQANPPVSRLHEKARDETDRTGKSKVGAVAAKPIDPRQHLPTRPEGSNHATGNPHDELTDEQIDALSPELPQAMVQVRQEAVDDPSLEMSDEELDALPPELPQPDKPRKRIMAAPKKPRLDNL